MSAEVTPQDRVEAFTQEIQQITDLAALTVRFNELLVTFGDQMQWGPLYGTVSLAIRNLFQRALQISTAEVIVLENGKWVYKNGTIHMPTEAPEKVVFSPKTNIYRYRQ